MCRVVRSPLATLLPLLALAGAALALQASPSATTSTVGASVTTLSQWTLSSTADPATTYQVTAPNTVLGALFESGSKPYDFEPFYGKNLDRVNKSDFDVPWQWATTFSLPSDYGSVVLDLDGIIFHATVSINGQQYDDEYLFGAFRRFKLDITKLCKSGTNAITITVVKPYEKPKEVRDGTGLSISFYDWDPHPADLSMGLWRPVSVHVLPRAAPLTINGLSVKTELSKQSPTGKYSDIVFLNLSIAVKNWGSSAVSNESVWISLGAPVSQTVSRQVTIAANSETRVVFSYTEFAQLVLLDAESALWYPWQMGDATLIEATAGAGTTTLYTRNVGLRQIESKFTIGGALQIYVNKLPIQIRAGAWCPDLFMRTDNVKLANQFRMVKGMNLNAIRLEGKGEHDAFFQLADQQGILLLADVGCCEKFPDWNTTEFTVAQKAMREQVRKLSPHPSVAWILASSDFLGPIHVERAFYQIYNEEAWPNIVVSSASENTSPLTGTSGVKLTGPYSWVPPSYWLEDSSPSFANKGGAWGFFTEGGPGESPMTFNSWNRTVPAEHLWSTTEGSLSSWFDYYMGNPNGGFPSLQYFTPALNARYGTATSAEGFLYRAQAANLESIRAMYEGYSRNKHRNATGVVQWMMNNARPSHLWHLYDYYLGAGGGFYGARRACQALHGMVSPADGTVTLLNSLYQDILRPITVRALVVDLQGNVRSNVSTVIPALEADASLDLPALTVDIKTGGGFFSAGDTFFVVIEWTVDGQTKDNWYWFSPTADVIDWAYNGSTAPFRTICKQWANFTALQTLAPVKFTNVKADVRGSTVSVTFTNGGSVPAFFVSVRVASKATGFDLNPQVWEDNYVSLMPGATRTLSADLSGVGKLDAKDLDLFIEAYNNVVN